jgi:hypothetical protein
LEVIRDVMMHPLSTISEKIQSVLSSSTTEQSEQTTPDTTKPSTTTFEEAEVPKEQQLSVTEVSYILKTGSTTLVSCLEIC